jgi:hypothetical protein
MPIAQFNKALTAANAALNSGVAGAMDFNSLLKVLEQVREKMIVASNQIRSSFLPEERAAAEQQVADVGVAQVNFVASKIDLIQNVPDLLKAVATLPQGSEFGFLSQHQDLIRTPDDLLKASKAIPDNAARGVFFASNKNIGIVNDAVTDLQNKTGDNLLTQIEKTTELVGYITNPQLRQEFTHQAAVITVGNLVGAQLGRAITPNIDPGDAAVIQTMQQVITSEAGITIPQIMRLREAVMLEVAPETASKIAGSAESFNPIVPILNRFPAEISGLAIQNMRSVFAADVSPLIRDDKEVGAILQLLPPEGHLSFLDSVKDHFHTNEDVQNLLTKVSPGVGNAFIEMINAHNPDVMATHLVSSVTIPNADLTSDETMVEELVNQADNIRTAEILQIDDDSDLEMEVIEVQDNNFAQADLIAPAMAESKAEQAESVALAGERNVEPQAQSVNANEGPRHP